MRLHGVRAAEARSQFGDRSGQRTAMLNIALHLRRGGHDLSEAQEPICEAMFGLRATALVPVRSES